MHDGTVAAVYDILANADALNTFVNAPGNNFHLWGMYNTGYDQEAGKGNDNRSR